MLRHGPSGPARARAGLGSLLLAAASSALVVLAVVGAELLLRAAAPDYLVGARGLHTFSPDYGWAPRRGATAVIEGGRVSVNARGHRGRELEMPKPGDRVRVVVLGDSIAFGLGVDDEDTFTHALDARRNGIEAANLAVQGYGPGQELLVLLGEGLGYEPDVVVLSFCFANDFADAVLATALYDGRSPKPRFLLVGDRLVPDDSSLRRSWPMQAWQVLSDQSHLFNRVWALGGPAEAPLVTDWRERRRVALRDEPYALRLNLALVGQMEAACRERGVRFLVAAFPTAFSWRSKPPLAEAFLAALERRGTPVVDMAARLEARGLAFADAALDRVGHLSPLGHAVASEVIEDEIAAGAGSEPGP